MFHIPPIGDVVLALTIAGGLFVLRFLACIRRLRIESGGQGGSSFGADARRVIYPNAFGAEFEAERRHAKRQLYLAGLFFIFATGAAAWMLVASVLGPFIATATGE